MRPVDDDIDNPGVVTLADIARNTVIDGFCTSDENGDIEHTNVPGLDFAFPTDPTPAPRAPPSPNSCSDSKKLSPKT